jgi:hypothetical protein
MRAFSITTVLILLLAFTAFAADPTPAPAPAMPKLSATMKADIETMQERVSSPDRPDYKVATPKAIGAATRVFSGLPLTGMTMEQVVLLLGKPSDYFPATSSAPGRMTYTFDNGPAGRQFVLALDPQGKITGIKAQHYD